MEGGKEQEELGEVKGAERQTGGKGTRGRDQDGKKAVDGMGWGVERKREEKMEWNGKEKRKDRRKGLYADN